MIEPTPAPGPPPRPTPGLTPPPGPRPTPVSTPVTSPAPPARAEPPAPLVRETGHGVVDGALARLAELDGVPVEAHAEVYEGVHEVLRDTLKGLDEPRPGQP